MTNINIQYSFIIKQELAKEYIEECNDNVITETFKNECKEVSKLFNNMR